eukprot:TRINITY_DN54964_c0_g1_i1.p1 TRINITY_DN54964_c0_g1~~TRINITY_DN54964_c0_g1_i1.p1  ORF type:complete len:548 (+),score=36.60 TRINITY_DN54964_c0_g1_i1:64-1644(+)
MPCMFRSWCLFVAFVPCKKASMESQPQKIGKLATDVGWFETWRYALQFDRFVFYARRFGVDVPVECTPGQASAPCPILVDFHGSSDSLYSQRAWTKWHEYLRDASSKYILLTPEGSPDALYREGEILHDCNDTSDHCIGTSATSWNVLGWGNTSEPLNKTAKCRRSDKQRDFLSNCFKVALDPNYTYQCFGTHLLQEPSACQRTQDPEAPSDQIPTVCMSASGANDAEYMERVLRFVISHYVADSRRIYFSGQSMGGMASLQFAAPNGGLPQDIRPAAIAPCSAGASRSSVAQLHGVVPTLLLWGYADGTAPPTVWQGQNRNPVALTSTVEFKSLLRNKTLLKQALEITGGIPHSMCALDVCSSVDCCVLLQANTLTGGKLLKATSLHRKLEHEGQLGCENDQGELTCIGGGGFMWEGISSTVQGIIGSNVDMSALSWGAPDKVPKDARDAVDLLCARVPAHATVEICIFNGGHSLPWNGGPGGKGYDWMPVAGRYGAVFHEFIWERFFEGGAILREDSLTSAIVV